MSCVYVVVPTYNERANLEELVGQVFGLGISGLRMIVVDDNSPDGTAALAETLAQNYPLKVIRRSGKMGLGTAYAAAFREILNSDDSFYCKADYVVQMDADLSHDPAVIPGLIQEMKNCDLVIGSRYVSGGGIENWELWRRVLSRWGNFYARTVLGLPYQDLTSGFKCYRREVLESIVLGSLSSVGYNFQIETVFKAHRCGWRIKELPISFTERKSGVSKLNLAIILESFFKVLLLRLHG